MSIDSMESCVCNNYLWSIPRVVRDFWIENYQEMNVSSQLLFGTDSQFHTKSNIVNNLKFINPLDELRACMHLGSAVIGLANFIQCTVQSNELTAQAPVSVAPRRCRAQRSPLCGHHCRKRLKNNIFIVTTTVLCHVTYLRQLAQHHIA